MCGITGFSGTKNSDLMKLKFLLYMNSVERGKDATGVYTPKSGIVKDNVKAEAFINNKRHSAKIQSDNVFIGHVRAKTIGLNSIANAHPFQFGSVVGCHNGTLQNHLDLYWEYQLGSINDYDVDSQILISCLNQNILNDNGNLKVLSEYEGAAALLFYNEDTKILHAYHDKERPLFYGYINNTEMYISSIRDSLEAIDCQDIKMFELNTVYDIREGQILNKTLYKPYVANIDNTRYEVAWIKDIEEMKGDATNIHLKGKHFTGFTYQAVRPAYTVGFWLEYSSYTKNHYHWEAGTRKGGRFTKGHFYKILSAHDDYFVEVEDENCTITLESLQNFNHEKFIPCIGRFVKLVTNITYTSDNSLAGKKDEVFQVTRYVYGNDKVWIKNIKGEEIVVSKEFMRVVTESELKEIKKNLDKKVPVKKTIEVTDQTLIDFNNDLPEKKIEPDDKVKNLEEEELPFKDDTPDIKKLQIEDDQEDGEEYTEDFIPYADYATVIHLAQKSVEVIQEKFQAGEDITVLLNELDSALINAYDISYVMNLSDQEED